jgi:phenylacetyl-CoA:acceptor oxidoreductase subunit 2
VNFIAGGAGGGLIVVTALAGTEGVARAVLVLAGLALIGTGLLAVWHELGRPRRALNVFLHARTSWMSREAIAATLLVPTALGAAAGVAACSWASAAFAAAFVVCQARMLQASRGIPAWREPIVVPLLVVTAFAEGTGIFVAASTLLPIGTPGSTLALGALALLRIVAWLVYRRAVARTASAPALRALDGAGRALHWVGTLAPLVLIVLATSGLLASGPSGVLLACAGVSVVVAGACVKYVLVLRAGLTQGFVLAHRPVRGVHVRP